MKQTGVVCQPGHVLLFSLFRFEYLITGPESYRGFRETGPWVPFLEGPVTFRVRNQIFKSKPVE